jgi:hypothetical protein
VDALQVTVTSQAPALTKLRKELDVFVTNIGLLVTKGKQEE